MSWGSRIELTKEEIHVGDVVNVKMAHGTFGGVVTQTTNHTSRVHQVQLDKNKTPGWYFKEMITRAE